MKFPRFIAGLFLGFAICLSTAALCYSYLYFPTLSGHYESPQISFYVSDDHPEFAEYEILNNADYWKNISISAESVANDHMEKNGFHVKVRIHCEGSAHGYTVFYSFFGSASMKQLCSGNEIRGVIVDHIDANYRSHLTKILAEQDAPSNR